MFNGAHVILYSHDTEADRAFLRDTLDFPGVEVAVHPTDTRPKHELYLMCSDIETVLSECSAKGVEVVEPASDQGWGVLAGIRLPSGTPLSIYEPRHPVAYDL